MFWQKSWKGCISKLSTFFHIIVHKNRLNLVEVDYSRFVAHLRRFVVVAPDCRESHIGVGGAHWDAKRRGRSLPVHGRTRVAHHETFPLQDNGLRAILSPRHPRDHSPAEHQYEGVRHGYLSLSLSLCGNADPKRQTVSCATSFRVPPLVSAAADVSDAVKLSY